MFPSNPAGGFVPAAVLLLLIMLLWAGVARSWHLWYSFHRSRLVAGGLILAILASLGTGWTAPSALAATPDAAAPSLPRYAYIVAASPTTYDLMLWDAGKDRLLVRNAVLGTGVSDAVARIAPDGQRVAYRLTNNRNSGSSLRLYDIQARKALTVTFSKADNLGIGTFAWSPNSQYLAFSWTTPAMPKPDTGYGSVWVVDATGKNQHKVLSAQLDDRFLAWDAASQGFYFERRQDMPTLDDPILHLMYQPLNGPARAVLRSIAPSKKSPGLLFDSFQIWAAPVVSGTTPAPVRVAALATGDLSLLAQAVPPAAAPAPAAPPATPPPAPPPPLTTAKLAVTTPPADKPALVVGRDDGAAFQPLNADGPRPDVLAWGSTGGYLLTAGGSKATAGRIELSNGQRITLADSLARMQPIAWSADGRYAVFANMGLSPATTLITVDMSTGKLPASRKVGTAAVAGKPVKNLDVPYINQVWDTANTVNGNWACGPTAVAMVLSYYGRLQPWPLDAKSAKDPVRGMAVPAKAGAEKAPVLIGRDYAQYISAPFTYKNRSFTRTTQDPAGHKVAGLYGSIVFADGLAHWEAMVDILGLYDLKTSYVSPTWGAITAAIDKGTPVLLGTDLTDEGHILVARGYTSGGYLVVNDPYGNKFGPNGYGGPDGENITYPWNKATVRMAMRVSGTIWTPPPTPTAVVTGTVTPAPALTAPPTPTPHR